MVDLLWMMLVAVLLLLSGVSFGLEIAARMGPNHKWRLKHGCRHGEEAKRD